MKKRDEKEVRKTVEAIDKGEPIPTDNQEEESKNRKQALRIVQYSQADALFCTPDGEPYATIENKGRVETIKISSRLYRRLLRSRFYVKENNVPSSQAISEAVSMLEAIAEFKGERYEVFVRVGRQKDSVYIDLVNDAGELIEIDKDGWRIVTRPPIKFRRTPNMKALPRPIRNSSINKLRPFVNVSGKRDWVLVVAWLVAALMPSMNHPILVLHGDWGSAKSTITRVLRMLFDDSFALLKSDPKDVRDLLIAAQNEWCIAFDNLSFIQRWLSDALCRLATGGAMSTRALYTDDEEKTLQAKRPVVMNGITEIVTKPDLLSRCQIVYLPRIAEEDRKTEEEFMADFEKVRPDVLGALCEAVSVGLRNLPDTKPKQLPRLADYARFIMAAEEGLGWETGTFLQAYQENLRALNQLALEASIIYQPFMEFLDNRVSWDHPWQGSAQELLNLLNEIAQSIDEKTTRQDYWPKTPQRLSNMLRESASNYRATGIGMEFGERSSDKHRTRLITIKRVRPDGSDASDDEIPNPSNQPPCDCGTEWEATQFAGNITRCRRCGALWHFPKDEVAYLPDGV